MQDIDETKRTLLRQWVIRLYSDGKLSAGQPAEILGVSLREFLEMLERERVAVKWDKGTFWTQEKPHSANKTK